MKPKHTLLLSLLFFTLQLSSQDLIPLKTGNHWTYEEKITEADTLVQVDTVENEVYGTVTFNDRIWFQLREFAEEYLVRNGTLGQFELDTSMVLDNGQYDEQLVFKKVPYGEAASYTFFGTNTMEVDAEMHSITTPAGTFECQKYKILMPDAPDDWSENYLAPGVGIVLQRWMQGTRMTESRLLQYDLK